MEFSVGDKAVYPAHGVGIIRDVVTKELDGERATFYVLKILDNGMTISVPVNNARSIGMRQVIHRDHVQKVYEILRDRDVPTDNQTWNRRYRDYMSKIKTGDPLEVAKVLRDLALLKSEKALSFGERKMFDQARSLLVQEIAVALDADEKIIGEEIDALFNAAAQPRT
jgi:CarD family transcriptional regulator